LDESNRAPATDGKGRFAGREVARGRDELTARKAAQSDILSMPASPSHQNKKTSKMKGGPNKLMKTNGQISDKIEYPDEYMKTNELHEISY
jgi:hypothetical protein